MTNPHRRPRASLPRCEVLDLSGSRPGRAVVVSNQQRPRTPPIMHAVTSPHRHLRASLPRCEVLDLRGSRPRRAVVVFNQQHPRTPSTPKHPPSRSSHRISVAVHTVPHAPLPLPLVLLVPPHARSFLSFMQDLARRSQCPRWSRHSHGVFLFLLQGSHPFLGRPFFLSTCIALRRAPRRPHARNLASPRTDDRRTNDATCGPQAWLTGRLH